MARFDLTDRKWSIIAPLLPNKPRGVGRTDDRQVLNGIFYTLRTGSPWRDLPVRYGPYTTAYSRYNRWAKAGVWLRIFETLPPAKAFIADRGYDARALVEMVSAGGGQAHIPTQSNVRLQRSVDPALYRQRNLIERFFNKLKHFRRLSTRFDKLA